jgi:hypothetical protein
VGIERAADDQLSLSCGGENSKEAIALFVDTGTADFPLLYFPIYSACSEYGN